MGWHAVQNLKEDYMNHIISFLVVFDLVMFGAWLVYDLIKK